MRAHTSNHSLCTQQASSGYQSLSSTPSRSSSHTDYYVVMSPGSRPQVGWCVWVLSKLSIQHSSLCRMQEDASDQSGDSVTSHRDHLALLETHNRHLEGSVSKNSEDVKKLTSVVEHLSRRVESLANQLRIMTFSSTGQGSEVSSASGSPSISAEHRSSPISVDNRPPAPLPGEGEGKGRGGGKA